MIEKIDRPEGKEDPTQELINEIISYLNSDRPIAQRLSLERKLKKYQENNEAAWLLNMTIRLYETWQIKEKS
jgi:hypothetical protein